MDGASLAADTLLEFEPVWGEAPLSIDRGEWAGPGGSTFTFTRLDLLLSGVALLQEEGHWLESRDWFAFLSAGQKKLRARLEGTPAHTFKGIRFSVGPAPAVNSSDPTQYPPGHALHPQQNRLLPCC